jgi:dGTPase
MIVPAPTILLARERSVPNKLYPNNDAGRRNEARPKPSDGRSPYRRDWARLIHSPCFRRLQGKTQLFPSDENDFYRNRLTHSLEVAQIASGIALNINQNDKFFAANPIDVDLVYFAALAHDLGHPPFGHNGERALDKIMARYGGFEGNAQTLRILGRLEKKETETFPISSDEPNPVQNDQDKRLGLNVTYRSLASILKYDREIPQIAEDRKDHQKGKPVKGYYFTEAELVREIKKNVLGEVLPDMKTIECGIMDVADDIAYSTYDLEDSLKAGFTSPLEILAFSNEFKEKIVRKINKELDEQYKTKKSDQLKVDDFDRIVVSTFQKIFGLSDDVWNRFKNKRIGSRELSAIAVISAGQTQSASAALSDTGYLRGEFTSKLVHEFMSAVQVKLNYSMPQLSTVSLEIETFKKVELFKTISFESIIRSPRLQMAERRGGAIIKEIFKTLADEKEGRRLLPEDWREVYFGFRSDVLRKRTICDFIANMTDRYCVEFYSRIVGLNPPSIHKPY